MEVMDKKIDIYYDGSCPMCSVFADTVVNSPLGEKFAKQDVTQGTLPEGATFDEVWKEMYVVENGKQYKGADAVLRVMEEYPLGRPIAFLGTLPILNQLAHLLYRIVAANRHRFNWGKH